MRLCGLDLINWFYLFLSSSLLFGVWHEGLRAENTCPYQLGKRRICRIAAGNDNAMVLTVCIVLLFEVRLIHADFELVDLATALKTEGKFQSI